MNDADKQTRAWILGDGCEITWPDYVAPPPAVPEKHEVPLFDTFEDCLDEFATDVARMKRVE